MLDIHQVTAIILTASSCLISELFARHISTLHCYKAISTEYLLQDKVQIIGFDIDSTKWSVNFKTKTFSFMLPFGDGGYQAWISFNFAWRFLFWIILCTQSGSSFKQTANLFNFNCLKETTFKIKSFLETPVLRKIYSRPGAAQVWFRREEPSQCRDYCLYCMAKPDLDEMEGCWNRGSMAVEKSCDHTLTSVPHIVQAQQQENGRGTNGEPKGFLILFSPECIQIILI